MSLLTVRGLSIHVARGGQMVPVLQAFDLTVRAGEAVALVGESGSGKTMAALGLMRLLPYKAAVTGEIMLGGYALHRLAEKAMRRVRGAGIGMVFQDALATLNPSRTIGVQIAEAFRLHSGASRAAGRSRALALLHDVGMDPPEDVVDLYPHQLSGGMRQRVLIAAALAGGPKMLIADEPTSGLDSETAAQVMAMLSQLRRELGMGLLLISHDLAAVRAHADRVHVLYAGRSVEEGDTQRFFAAPAHPYSRALRRATPLEGQSLAAIPGALPEPEAWPAGCRFAPRCPHRQPVCDAAYPAARPLPGGWAACVFPQTDALPAATLAMAAEAHRFGPSLLSVRNVSVRYRHGFISRQATRAAISDASFELRRGECLGLVGASGSGKTSLGRAVLQMLPYAGRVALDGVTFGGLRAAEHRRQRRRIQAVFQDPRTSLNPGMRILDIVAEPLLLAGMGSVARHAQAAALVARVGLPDSVLRRRPREVSGGQAQRVAIARALAAAPDVLVLDEPTSSLDVSTQAGILLLLRELAEENGFATLLISHDRAAVAFLADRIAVVAGGKIVALSDGPGLA